MNKSFAEHIPGSLVLALPSLSMSLEDCSTEGLLAEDLGNILQVQQMQIQMKVRLRLKKIQ